MSPSAKREVGEELGVSVEGDFIPLDPVKQQSGKVVFAWALQFDFDPSTLKSNTFSMEWPPNSGEHRDFPKVDQAAWFSTEQARAKILKAQEPFLNQLLSFGTR